MDNVTEKLLIDTEIVFMRSTVSINKSNKTRKNNLFQLMLCLRYHFSTQKILNQVLQFESRKTSKWICGEYIYWGIPEAWVVPLVANTVVVLCSPKAPLWLSALFRISSSKLEKTNIKKCYNQFKSIVLYSKSSLI